MKAKFSDFSKVKEKYLRFIKSQEFPGEPFRDKLGQLNNFYIPISEMIYKHYFCSECGIYTHHNPRINPAMTGFNVGCIDEIDTFKLNEVSVNDGQNHPLDKK